jgi:serine/threonine protein kinase
MLPSAIRENETVAGKYRIGRTLGEGGMGIVVAARHLELDQMVAIKFLRTELAEQSAAAERFRREARAAARIRSPHICRVLDVGTLETGMPFLVMEYLEGCDVSDELAKRGRFPVPEALDYVLQACEALSEAHAVGIVHRDLKPGNLFLESRTDGSRSIKVLDFGVSKSMFDSAAQLKLTKTASLIGSPLYMSPEQLDAATDVDARADIWALGTILYELIAGRTPFLAETIPQLVNAVVNGTQPSFQQLGIPAPLGLEAVVNRALNKRREDRFTTITEFAQALLPFAASYGAVSVSRRMSLANSAPGMMASGTNRISSSGRVSSGGTDPDLEASRTLVGGALPPLSSGTPSSWQRSPPPSKPNPRAIAIGLALVPILAAVVIAVLYWGGGSSEPVAPVPSARPAAQVPPPPAPDDTTTTKPAEPTAEPSPEPTSGRPLVTATVEPEPTALPPSARHPAGKPGSRSAQPAAKPSAAEAPAAKPEGSSSKPEPAGDSISDFGGRR